MTAKLREVATATALSLLIAACGPKSGDPIELQDTVSHGDFEVISVEPIPPEEVGDNRYFYGMLEASEIDNGGFEGLLGDDGIPVGWKGLLQAPEIEQDNIIVKLGKQSAKLTGSTEVVTHLRASTKWSSRRLRGKEVVFGMWVYSSHPEKTSVQIIEDWKYFTSDRPIDTNKWELVQVARVIPEASKKIFMSISLKTNDPPVVCYVDGAAMLVHDVDE